MTRRPFTLLILTLSAVLVLAACGGDDDSADTTSAGDPGGDTTSAPDDGGTTTGGGVDVMILSTSDGGSWSLDVSGCDNPSESTVRISASSENADLEVDATEGAGSLALSSAEGDRTGTVELVQVGDAGALFVSGAISPAGGGDESETFDLSGTCLATS